MDAREKLYCAVTATFNFYEKDLSGGFDTEPSTYVARGKNKQDILDNMGVLWQAIEIECFGNSEVFVTVDFEENGAYLDRDEFVMRTNVVRTTEPSGFVVWGNKKPHIFKIDKNKSSISIDHL